MTRRACINTKSDKQYDKFEISQFNDEHPVRSTAEIGYDENDDDKEESCEENSACNSSVAPQLERARRQTTDAFAITALLVVRTGTRRRTIDALATTAFLAPSTLAVVRTRARRRITDAIAITALLATVTFGVGRTETKPPIYHAFAITALLGTVTLESDEQFR
ncbi:hypothetical protein AWC38_SpisGene9975 [Stylophora pistillata]|uniref:Uncharacterized protein n=1 Tax=Stylophora pistillata TaxID=50429 RepID=A0A2B4S8N4_STYPI|nr:hypothetical protein AWC38_SpisGene9975 [Stylophora pistillata]